MVQIKTLLGLEGKKQKTCFTSVYIQYMECRNYYFAWDYVMLRLMESWH